MTTSACEHGEPHEEEKEYTSGPKSLNVDLDALTYGKIDWERAHGSLQWLVDKVKNVCEEEGKEQMENYETGRSQFLAKLCVMHVIHTFHACRFDEAHGQPGQVETEEDAAKENAEMQTPMLKRQDAMDTIWDTVEKFDTID